MKVKILDHEFKFQNSSSEVNAVLNKIERSFNSSECILSKVIIDGVEIQDYRLFIKNNIEFIGEINVELVSISNYINDILKTTLDYLENALPLIHNLSNDFYSASSLNDNNINRLADLIEATQWILDTFNSINKNHNYTGKTIMVDEWSEYTLCVSKLTEAITDLGSAIDTIDLILIADILKYEISSIFNDMITQLKKLDSLGADYCVN